MLACIDIYIYIILHDHSSYTHNEHKQNFTLIVWLINCKYLFKYQLYTFTYNPFIYYCNKFH